MGGADGRSLKPAQVARRTHTRPLLSFLLYAIALTAITAVVVATAMGQSTVALVVGLVSAAFFAGILS
jgi:hypothetical protein